MVFTDLWLYESTQEKQKFAQNKIKIKFWFEEV